MGITLKKVKLGKTPNLITAFGGLGIFHNVILCSYFYDDLKSTCSYMQKRKRGYSPARKILSHMELILSGGESLSDISMLNNDLAYKKVTNTKSLPSHTTLDDFYNSINKRDYKNYEELNLKQAIEYYKKNKKEFVTIDIDSSLSFTEKKTAKYSYEKKRGFNPMYVVDEKNKIILSAKFRNGNASPQKDIFELMIKVISKLKEVIPQMKISVRIDSAGYQLKIIKYLVENLYNFVIKGDVKLSKSKEFELIHQKKWKKISDDEDICRVTTTINSGSMNFKEVDAIVKRKLIYSKEKGYLEDIYSYTYVVTNISKYEISEEQIFVTT